LIDGIEVESWSTEEICPTCGLKGLELRHLVYKKDEGFELFIQVCPKCGFKEHEFMDVLQRGYVKYTIHVKRAEDYNTLIYRSPSGLITIPELGIEITPTSRTLPRITTIEGFMTEIRDRLLALFSPEEMNSKIEKLNEALKGKLPITFVLEDKSGSSWVKPKEGTLVEKIR
jgi:C4-type Zn-finger protein